MNLAFGAVDAMMFLSQTPAAGSLDALLQAATAIVTWVITQMGAFVGFIVENPVVLMLFLLMLVGFAVGLLMRIWRSVG